MFDDPKKLGGYVVTLQLLRIIVFLILSMFEYIYAITFGSMVNYMMLISFLIELWCLFFIVFFSMTRQWEVRVVLMLWSVFLLLIIPQIFQHVPWIFFYILGLLIIVQLMLLVSRKPMEMVFIRTSKEDEIP